MRCAGALVRCDGGQRMGGRANTAAIRDGLGADVPAHGPIGAAPRRGGGIGGVLLAASWRAGGAAICCRADSRCREHGGSEQTKAF